jgi:hypothetical protein
MVNGTHSTPPGILPAKRQRIKNLKIKTRMMGGMKGVSCAILAKIYT